MTIQETTTTYLIHCRLERYVAESTAAKYKDLLRTWVVPYLGDVQVEALERPAILKLRAAMQEKDLSINRQYAVLMCLKGLLKYINEVLKMPTLQPSEVLLPKRPNRDVEYLTNDEVQQMLAAIDVFTYSGARLRAFVELLLATGMRLSEALSLERSLFDAGMKETTIMGKGKRKRDVFFSDRCIAWVQYYLNKRTDANPALFVTTGYEPRRWCREDISRFFIALRNRAKISKHLTPHLLRHTFCTHLLFNGVDIANIRDLAGHSDIGMTAKYYLGRDRRVLRRELDEKLNYGSNDPVSLPLAHLGSQQ